MDLWSDSAFEYANSVEWNEVMPSQYIRKAGSSVSIHSYWSANYLRSLWSQLENPEVLEAKRSYYDSVMARAMKSKGPQFFPPVVSVADNAAPTLNNFANSSPLGG